jgi:hypothetical protein
MDSQRFQVDLLADEMQNWCELLRRQRDQSTALREHSRQMRERLCRMRAVRHEHNRGDLKFIA